MSARLPRGESRARADALLRRRRAVTAADVTAELAGADASELRRWLLFKLSADDLEPENAAPMALIAAHAGLGAALRDVQAVAADARRPAEARAAAAAVLAACIVDVVDTGER